MKLAQPIDHGRAERAAQRGAAYPDPRLAGSTDFCPSPALINPGDILIIGGEFSVANGTELRVRYADSGGRTLVATGVDSEMLVIIPRDITPGKWRLSIGVQQSTSSSAFVLPITITE